MNRAFAVMLLVGVAVGVAACGSSHPRGVHGAPPAPSPAELGKLARVALDAAKRAGDAHPTDAIVVPTTRRIAEAVDAGSGIGVASAPAYFVVVHGQFKDCGVPIPPGANCPSGTFVTLTIDPRTNESSDFGIDSRMPDVNKIGTSHPLPLGTANRSAAPSLPTDLRITRNVPCLHSNTRRVGPTELSRLRAVTAVLCGDGQHVYPGQGQWEVFVRKVAVSPVSGLQQYFEQPSKPTIPKNGLCTANLVYVETPAFVDAQGHWLVPKAPVDRCGHPLGAPAGMKTTQPVRWRVVSFRKIKLLLSAPALAAGCDMKWGRSGPVRLPSGPVFVNQPRMVNVCVYRTSARHVWTGNFARGFRLDSSQTQRLLSSMTGAAPRAGCPRERSFAEVIAGPGEAVNVELGGCYRVDGFRTADGAVVRAILGRG